MHSTPDHALSPYFLRLSARGGLDDNDRAAFLSMPARVEICAPGKVLVAQGAPIKECIFLIDGFISRTKIMDAQQTQVLAFCLPGDAVDLQSLFMEYADHSLETHAPSTVAVVPQAALTQLMRAQPNLMKALWIDALVDAAIFREWALNLGRRSARQRIGHLLLELEARYRAYFRSERRTFPVPVKQAALASALGLSLVHLNKSLQWLRREGLVEVRGRTFEIIRRDELVTFCNFDPAYLHLRGAVAPAQVPQDQRHIA